MVESAPADAQVLDLDRQGLGVGAESAAPTREELVAALRGATVARGSLLSTADGVAAAIEAGVSTIVAKPVLPVQLLAVRHSVAGAS